MSQRWPRSIETVKRLVYLSALPIGAACNLVLWSLERRNGTLSPVNEVGLPLLTLLYLVLTIGIWRWRARTRLFEFVLFGGFALIYLANQLHPVFALRAPAEALWKVAASAYWTPVQYTLAFLVFGVRTGLWLSLGLYLLSLGVWLGYFWTLPITSLTLQAQSLFFQLFTSNGLTLLLLATTGYVVAAQARQAVQLELAANTDPLTLLSNRRHLIALMEHEVARVKRHGRAFSVLLIDLDNFKTVNDVYGHDVGDDVLVEVSTLLRENIRTFDVLGRWGGEEFIVLLPESHLSHAHETAERLRALVADHPFEPSGTVTASFGVAEYRPGEPLKSLFRRADGALYEAKSQGRNRVVAEALTLKRN